MLEDISLEDVAMTGQARERKAEKADRKRLRPLEAIKRNLNVDEVYDDKPLEASEIEESLLKLLKSFKDPMVKDLLGMKIHKQSVNNLIDIINDVAMVRKKEDTSLLKKV